MKQEAKLSLCVAVNYAVNNLQTKTLKVLGNDAFGQKTGMMDD